MHIRIVRQAIRKMNCIGNGIHDKQARIYYIHEKIYTCMIITVIIMGMYGTKTESNERHAQME